MHNKYVIIGSTAIKYNLEKKGAKRLPSRFSKSGIDLDIMTRTKDKEEIVKKFQNVDIINGDVIMDAYHFSHEYASLDEIYTLKMSHIFWDHGGKPGQWFTHINDIVALRKMGCTIIEPLYEVAKAEWVNRFGKPGASLNVNKEEFFSSGVDRYVDHDSLHASIAFYERPLFYEFLKDGEEVLTDKNKFMELDYEKKIRAVQEEAMVLALERDIIPLKIKPSESEVYNFYIKNLKKLITQYSSGWFPRFISEEWENIAVKIKDKDMIDDFLRNLGKEGKIIPGELWDNKKDLWWSSYAN